MKTSFIAGFATLMLASAQAQSSNSATGVVSPTSGGSNDSKEPLPSSSNVPPTESSQTPTHTPTHAPTPTSSAATASSSSAAPTRSVKPDPSVTPPQSRTTETEDDDDDDTPTHQPPTHAPTTRPSNPSRPTPTWIQPTANPDIPAPSPSSRSRQTVVAVITVVVDGSVSLSSETTVIDDGSAGYGENESDGRVESNGRPFTSTIFENGSAVVVTGNLDDPQSVNSGAMRSVAGPSMKAALAASAAALVLVALF
ncbi:hypothetical protein IW146_003032 [Coemansia sp. RSA 922]|nr:hypothetical protein IW146_003032 [Coemansia sp. RSA 922]